mmetsp:Transcript_80433/g.239647  ORF Transcript_80433/g.239647 Transcript_80433/m.239647 type:complete len:349 (-) Transcript_80433:42-1088(-)
MLSVEELAELPPRQYLERFHVEFYLRDIICLFLARRRGDSRSPPEFISQYLEAVLRGEHVLHRGFKYINSTPVNRRAFVGVLRQGLRGVRGPETTALTPHDFHDLVSHLCGDFPLAIVLEAARHAKRADPRRHHLLGENVPVASSDLQPPLGSEGAASPDGAVELYVFRSLQRLAEFCLVYSELLGAVRHLYREEVALWPARPGASEAAAGGADSSRAAVGSAPGDAVRWPRSQLAAELRFYGSALAGAAMPSERALRRLSRPAEDEGPPGGEERPIGFSEALAEMVELFELAPATYPEELAGRAGALPEEAQGTGSTEPVSATVPVTRAGAAERRRRERSLRAKGRG